ncbi:MAG: prenyltransferase/squalene oxidase repeat-containing protein [Myxococcota bacterium]
MKSSNRALQAGLAKLLDARRPDAHNDLLHWEGEVVWNPMLAAQFVIARHAMGRPLAKLQAERVLRQLEVMQLEKGCWGMHRYGEPSLFVTVLAYVAARLCGWKSSDKRLAGARDFIRRENVLNVPSWGKVWLSIANLYEWDGVNAVPPEAWLLPKAVPLHPSNYYCHTRLIYMGMASVRALRVTAPFNETTRALRAELYAGQAYETIDFARARGRLREGDLWERPSAILRAVYGAVNVIEPLHVPALRARLIKRFTEAMRFELRSTDYTCLSPVNGLLFALTLHAQNPSDPDLERQLARFGGDDDSPLKGWVWQDDDEGLRVTGARSATWDTSFVLQALSVLKHVDIPELRAHVAEGLEEGLRWLETQQIRSTAAERGAYGKHDRVDPVGGFCFAGIWHGWPVSDCTAEALLAFADADAERYAPAIRRAVRFLLQAQNFDGGFGSYEARKSRAGLEWMNPAEMFGDSMTELSYYECTASNACALRAALDAGVLSGSLSDRAQGALERAGAYLRASQNEDGSWDGAWGVAYLYGTLFGVRGLKAAGADATDPAVQRACAFVLEKQREDGAFAECWRSCLEDRFIAAEESHPTQTAWALSTLLEGDVEDARVREAAERAALALRVMQEADGTWRSPRMTGVFFRTALLDYRLYRQIFPLWALASFEATLGTRAASTPHAGASETFAP